MNTQKICPTLILFFTSIISLLTTNVPLALGDMQSSNYSITTSAISGGGGTMSSASYQLQTIIGQSSALISQNIQPQSASYDLYPGFLYTLGAGTVCPNLSVFSISFGSISGNTNYNPSCDLDSDGDIDGSDLHSFISNI